MAAIKTCIRPALLGIGLAVVFLWGTQSASANHYTYVFQGMNAGQFGRGPTSTWAFRAWNIENHTAYYCNGLYDLGGNYVTGSQDAIADWESRFPWPWPEFTNRCAAGQSMDIVYRTGPWGGWPCGAGNSCVIPTWSGYDSARGGYYVTYFRVWFDNTPSVWNYSGIRATIAHELGHVYGLHEQNLDSQGGFACNNSINSIMDTAFATGACDGSYSPWQVDLERAHENYVMGTTGFQPKNLTSLKGTTNTMLTYWDDFSPTESHYHMKGFFWTGSQWSEVLSWERFSFTSVAFGDAYQPGLQHNESFIRSSGWAVNWYAVCTYLNNTVIGDRYWKCFPYQWLGS